MVEGQRVRIVGTGRLGRVLGRALTQAGWQVEGPVGRMWDPATAHRVDVALLCVPDAEISQAAQQHRTTAIFVGHTSGATPITEVDFGIHPLQTFTGREGPEVFHGVSCAVAAHTPAAEQLAQKLVHSLEAKAFFIADENRAAYHAAACIASNFLVTLEDMAEQVAVLSGIEPSQARSMLAPLVRSTVANWVDQGPERALTGPIARGDDLTVARQRDAIAADAPELLGLFDELVLYTQTLVARRNAAL